MPRKTLKHATSSKTVQTIPQLRRLFEEVEDFVDAHIAKRTSKDTMVKEFRKMWKRLFMKEMDKKAYKPSDAVEEYIDAFAYPGQTNLVYDEIKPNDEWIEANLKGSSKTGNATKDKDGNDLGNVVSSELGEKMYKNFKDNVYGAEQMNASYKRYPQPVDQAGEGTEDGDLKLKKGSQKSEKIFKQLESKEDKKTNLMNEQISRMMNIVGYNQKTQ